MWIRWLLRPYCSHEKFLSILYRSEICALLACFCLFGCHSNAQFPWKIQIAYLNSTIPKPYHICRNWHYIAYKTEICAFLAFLCKFGCYGNSLCSPIICISIFEFSDSENPTIHANICLHSFYWTEICGILVYSQLSVNTSHIKRKFYMACNGTLSYCHSVTEFVKLGLVKAYCLPLLT